MGGQGGCEQRIISFCENSKKKNSGGGGGVGGGVGLGGQSGCERRIEKIWGGGGSGWGVRVDVNEELKFF